MSDVVLETINAEGYVPSAEEKIAYLMQSETINLVLRGKYKPKEIDSAMRNMKKQIEELKYQSFLDKSEIVRLRRQVEFLIGHDNAEV